MDVCHLENAELAKHLQKDMERVVFRKDEEKIEGTVPGLGGSASLMAAAKFLDTISKLPGMAGETSDAVSACTHDKIEAPRWLKHVLRYGSRFLHDKVPKVGIILTSLWYLLKVICMVTNQPAFLKKDNLKMCRSRKDGTRYQRGNVFTCTRSSDYSHQFTWTM